MSRGSVAAPFSARPLFSLRPFCRLLLCGAFLSASRLEFPPADSSKKRRDWKTPREREKREKRQAVAKLRAEISVGKSGKGPVQLTPPERAAIYTRYIGDIYASSAGSKISPDRINGRCLDFPLRNGARSRRERAQARSILRRRPVLPAERTSFRRSVP